MAVEERELVVLVSGERRVIPEADAAVLTGWDAVPDDFVNNGCSSSPDYWRGRDLWAACRVHDFHYSPQSRLGRSGTWADRRQADAIFRRNVFKILNVQGISMVGAWLVAVWYWRGVRWGGWTAFPYRTSEIPRTVLHKAREKTGAFTDKRSQHG